MQRASYFMLGLALFVALSGATKVATWSQGVPVGGSGGNNISGTVFDDTRRPVVDIYVELTNELGVTVRQTKTSGGGRYSFFGLANGRYKVKAMPFGTDFMEQSQDVSLQPISAIPGGGAESVQLDFYLRLRPSANAGPFGAPGTVFAQEVAEQARKLYERALIDLREKREKEGFDGLRQALEVAPNYFLALDRLGTEYAIRGTQEKRYLEAARILLTKAVEVNPNSFSSTFGLGFSQYHLGLIEPAIENLQRATNLYNKSVNAYLWHGIALKRVGKLEQAEAVLKRANDMSKGKEADVHWQLAGLYSDQKRYTEAADELEKFLRNKPDARDAEKIRQLIAQLRQKAPKP